MVETETPSEKEKGEPMSFSNQVKTELCRGAISRRCCARAEAYGALLFCRRFTREEIRVVTASPSFAKRLPELFRRAFRVEFDAVTASAAGKQTFSLTNPAKLIAVREAFGYEPEASLAHHINFAMVEEDHCRSAFLRGAFLAGGSVSDPSKSYHLELCTTHFNVSREFAALLREAGFEPKQTTRKSNYITYFKPSETIADFLTAL